jgi:hypothetical protein
LTNAGKEGDKSENDPTPVVVYSIGDTVFMDANGNGVQDTTEVGVANVALTLDNGLTAITDQNGKYMFSNLPLGSYKVTVTLPTGYVATTSTSISKAITGIDLTFDFGINVPPATPSLSATGQDMRVIVVAALVAIITTALVVIKKSKKKLI